MSKALPLPAESARFLRQRFAAYYQATTLPVPQRIASREFGFVHWTSDGGSVWSRHHAAATKRRLAELLASGPHSAYVSAAFYRAPWRSMPEKQWLGATLGFDIDADHLRPVRARPDMDFAEQLQHAKAAVRRIIDDFLTGDLGLDADRLRVTFSGGRGYHILTDEEKVLRLDGTMRRELCDYVTGTTAEPARLALAPCRTAWPDRLRPRLADCLQEKLVSKDADEARAWLAYAGLHDTDAHDFLHRLDDAYVEDVRHARLRCDGLDRRALDAILRTHVIPLAAGEPDAPVTGDVSRLFRLPGSLHGGTGLRCMSVDLDALAAFEPLRHAVAFADELIPVHATADAETELARRRSTITAGADAEVPESHAVFLIARGAAVPQVTP